MPEHNDPANLVRQLRRAERLSIVDDEVAPEACTTRHFCDERPTTLERKSFCGISGICAGNDNGQWASRQFDVRTSGIASRGISSRDSSLFGSLASHAQHVLVNGAR